MNQITQYTTGLPASKIKKITFVIMLLACTQQAIAGVETLVVDSILYSSFERAVAARGIEALQLSRVEQAVLAELRTAPSLSAGARSVFSGVTAIAAIPSSLLSATDLEQAMILVDSEVEQASRRLPEASAVELALGQAASSSPAPRSAEPAVSENTSAPQSAVESAMRTLLGDKQVAAAMSAVKTGERRELFKLILRDLAGDLAARRVAQNVAIERALAALRSEGAPETLVGRDFAACATAFPPLAEDLAYSTLIAAGRLPLDASSGARVVAMADALSGQQGISRCEAMGKLSLLSEGSRGSKCGVFGPAVAREAGSWIHTNCGL